MMSIDDLNRLSPLTRVLNERVHKFLELFCRGDYEQCFNATYPGLFRKFPKKFLLKKMKETLENEEMRMMHDLVSIDKIGKMIKTDSGSYCRIDYTLLSAIRFRDVEKEDMENREEKKKFILSALRAQYGKKNIWFEEITKSYCFHRQNSMIAIKDKISPDWTFLTLTDNPEIKELLPKNILIVINAS